MTPGPPKQIQPIRSELSEDALARVSSRHAQAYARSKGWERGQRVGHLDVWGKPNSLDQVLVPVDAARRDYAERMLDAVRRFAADENRRADRVLCDLLHYDADVLRFRLVSTRSESGTLPLLSALDLLGGAKQSLLSAAHSVLQPKKHHPKLSRREAVQLVEACDMGQTEHGSFVVQIVCPLDAVDSEEAGPTLDDPRPFARQTTSLLASSIAWLKESTESDSLDGFEDGPDAPTASANLCEALLRMRPQDERGLLQLRPSWAPAHPAGEREAAEAISLGHDDFDQIEAVYRWLRPREAPSIEPRVAYVDELRGAAEDAAGRREGEVILTVVDEEEPFRVRASLDAEQYATAIQLHSPATPLVVLGELIRGPRVSRLTDIRVFKKLDLATYLPG